MKIAAVGLITKDRPRCLARAAESYLENARRFGRRVELAVVDDSSAAHARRNVEALKAAAARYGMRVFHSSLRERSLFLSALASAGVSPKAAAFGLRGFPGLLAAGAGRNGLLLHSAGEAFFGCDDDVSCGLARPPGARNGPVALSRENPERYWFFEGRASALSFGRRASADLLGLHERFLGRGGVVATLNGLVGDCALVSPRAYLRLEGDSRRRLTGSAAAYRRALNRQVLRAAVRPTVAQGVGFVTAAVAYDNRELLPPFVPALRNEDGLFGCVLRRCRPEARWLHLPWALSHEPAERRAFKSRDYGRMELRANDLLHHCVLAADVGAGPAASRLRALGRGLRELGAASDGELIGLLRPRLDRARALQVLHWKSLLARHGGRPAYWARDVRRCVEALERELSAPDLTPPADLPNWRAFRRLTAGFGGLLEAWPDMVQAARELKARGIGLARPIS